MKSARLDSGELQPECSGILNERVLVLVLESINWDIQTLCAAASVNRHLRAVAKRVLWRELCSNRAPRMAAALSQATSLMGGGWHTLAKLMFFCSGSPVSDHFDIAHPSPGHFVRASRFSKTSGRSFLPKGCRSDVLFLSDPCEHRMVAGDDLGVFRGVFEGFMRSRTRACLIGQQAELDALVRCTYCGSRMWSMSQARLIPKSAARRLGSHHKSIDYFICVNGHLHGGCWLVPLSSEEENASTDGDYVPML